MNFNRNICNQITTKKSYGFASLRSQNLTFSKSGLIPQAGQALHEIINLQKEMKYAG
jgi:hypothetical protein